MRIEGTDLPGRACGTDRQHENVHVGVQRGREPYGLVPGDAESATWEFELAVKPGDGGSIDVGGPFAQGRKGDRFLYLTWGSVGPDGTFDMFRRAKLHIADVDPGTLAWAAAGEATLVGRLGLTDDCGLPLCARVHPPTVTWSLA